MKSAAVKAAILVIANLITLVIVGIAKFAWKSIKKVVSKVWSKIRNRKQKPELELVVTN